MILNRRCRDQYKLMTTNKVLYINPYFLVLAKKIVLCMV